MQEFLKKYKIGKREIWLIVSVLFTFSIFVIVTVNKQRKRNSDLGKSHRYTIGTTTGKIKNIRSSGPDLNFTFSVNKIMYKGSKRFNDDGHITLKGGRYLVKYQPENPNNNEILLEFTAPDSIITCPDSGWIYPPFK